MMESNREHDEGPSTPSFRFFQLPYELRLRVYEYLLLYPRTIDLDPYNHRVIAPLLRLFFVSRRMHDEAAPVFYGMNTFRLLPTYGRFFHSDTPLLARLPSTYRAYVTKVELYLGYGWTKPPPTWVINEGLGLHVCKRLRVLKVFVRFDPSSHPSFEDFQQQGPDHYTEFSVGLVRDFVAQVPSLVDVEMDAEPEVQKSSPLLQGVLNEAKAHGKRITWGPKGEWDKRAENDLVSVLQNLRLGRLQPTTSAQLTPLA